MPRAEGARVNVGLRRARADCTALDWGVGDLEGRKREVETGGDSRKKGYSGMDPSSGGKMDCMGRGVGKTKDRERVKERRKENVEGA